MGQVERMLREAVEAREAPQWAVQLQQQVAHLATVVQQEAGTIRLVQSDVEVRREKRALRASNLAFGMKPYRRNPNMARFGKRKKRRA